MPRRTHDSPQLTLGLPAEQPSDATLRWCYEQVGAVEPFEEYMKTPSGIACRAWARAIERRRRNHRKGVK